MTTIIDFLAKSEAETDRLAAALAAELPRGTTLALQGTLGAGKTRFVQGFAAALAVPRDETSSPTFVLVHEYAGSAPLYHVDAYRLRDEDEFAQLGPEEFFAAGGYVLIEWADRVAACLPVERVTVLCDAVGETTRRFRVAASSPTLISSLERTARRLQS